MPEPDDGGKPLVIAVGNPDRGDDAVGRIVGRKLMMRRPSHLRIVEHSGESTGLLDCLGSAEIAYVVDACVTGGLPGTISRFDVATAPLPSDAFSCSTHGMGLAHAVELARVLGILPQHCVVYAINGRRFEMGAALSPEVSVAAEKVADLIWNELGRPLPDRAVQQNGPE